MVHYHVSALTDDTSDFASHFAGKADTRVLYDNRIQKRTKKVRSYSSFCVCVCVREREILRVCMWCCSERDDARGTWGGRRTTHLLPWRQHQSLTRVPRRVSASTFIRTSKRGSIVIHSLHKLVKFASWLLFLLIDAFLFKKKITDDDDDDDMILNESMVEWMNDWVNEWNELEKVLHLKALRHVGFRI